MVWIALLGVALQVIGLVIAILGVARTYRDTQGSSLVRDIPLGFVRWIRRVVLRRSEVKVAEGSATASLGVQVTGRGVARENPPDDTARSEEWIRYLNRRVEQLDRRVEEARQHATDVAAAAEKRVLREVSQLAERVQAVDSVASAAHSATIGRDGAGLRETAVGLAITALGVAFTVAGLPW